MNANTWSRNLSALTNVAAPFRYDNFGETAGGPVWYTVLKVRICIARPLADARGSVRSHDREGVILSKYRQSPLRTQNHLSKWRWAIT
jgi:hypothetical protein